MVGDIYKGVIKTVLPGMQAAFVDIGLPRAAYLHEALARQSILTRLFSEPSSLRFGLPGDEAEWTRLDTALADLATLHATEAMP